MLDVTPAIQIPLDQIDWSYARSGGPGGQNVNKVASKAVLRWPMIASELLPPYVKARVAVLYPSRVTADGDVLITSQEYRDQERNREACLTKLAEMLRAAAKLPRPRKATKPSKGSKLRRLVAKKKQAGRRADRAVGSED